MGKRGRTVFVAGNENHTWEDVAEDARRRGTWATLERATAAGMAALDEARQAGAAPARESIRQAEAAWRHERRLVAAEDLEAWLAVRAVTVAEWRNWVQCDLALAARPAQDARPAATAIDDALWVTGWCSRAFERLARDFAGRVAARLHLAATGLDLPLDEAFDQMRLRTTTEDAIGTAVSANQLEWLAIEGDCVVLPDEDVASEGLACVRDDGLTMEQLAATLGAPVLRRRIMVGDVPDELRQRFLSAEAGDHLGPVPTQGGVMILTVQAKILPSAEDEAIRVLASHTLLSRAVERAIEEQVRWIEPV